MVWGDSLCSIILVRSAGFYYSRKMLETLAAPVVRKINDWVILIFRIEIRMLVY